MLCRVVCLPKPIFDVSVFALMPGPPKWRFSAHTARSGLFKMAASSKLRKLNAIEHTGESLLTGAVLEMNV